MNSTIPPRPMTSRPVTPSVSASAGRGGVTATQGDHLPRRVREPKPPHVPSEVIRADWEASRLSMAKEAKQELYAAFRAINRRSAPKLQRWHRAGQELRVFK
jgi:hypothetical protein